MTSANTIGRLNTLIVGGGLAGLSLAHALRADSSVRLVEARDRFGGRILSRGVAGEDGTAAFDLGPTWFWRGQPRMAALIEQLGLSQFEQYATGDLVYQDELGHVHRGRGFSSMEGLLRVVGGVGALIDSLAEPLGALASLETKVTKMSYSGDVIETVARLPDGAFENFVSECVVLAIPPRVAADAIEFGTGIPQAAIEAMRAVPTWMAGHAKAVAVYDRPFWREAGLSGDAMSRRGPLAEVHDASPDCGGPFALFGFFGVGAEARQQNRDRLPDLIVEQLVQLFGEKAAAPIDLLVKDWAFDDETAIDLDRQATGGHPSYGLPTALRELWDGRLVMGSTEIGSEFGGYLEGALEAAEDAAKRVSHFTLRRERQ